MAGLLSPKTSASIGSEGQAFAAVRIRYGSPPRGPYGSRKSPGQRH